MIELIKIAYTPFLIGAFIILALFLIPEEWWILILMFIIFCFSAWFIGFMVMAGAALI